MMYVNMRFPEGKAKCVTFSYDDARKSDIRLSDMLQKYGIKCTFNITEQFALQKLLRNRGTVDSNKGFIPSSAQLMDCTGDDFFTRAAFTNHHNAGWAGCNTANESF